MTTQGVVVGDYEGRRRRCAASTCRTSTGDGNAATSDAVFVFEGSNDDSVNLGDVVRVTGNAGEVQGQTQVSSVAGVTAGELRHRHTVDADRRHAARSPRADFPERYEGMLVRMPQTLTVTEHFQLGRFGEVLMSSGGRLPQPTNVVAPGAPAPALQAPTTSTRSSFDDAVAGQNPDPILFGRGGQPLSASNTLRGGDTATGMRRRPDLHLGRQRGQRERLPAPPDQRARRRRARTSSRPTRGPPGAGASRRRRRPGRRA